MKTEDGTASKIHNKQGVSTRPLELSLERLVERPGKHRSSKGPLELMLERQVARKAAQDAGQKPSSKLYAMQFLNPTTTFGDLLSRYECNYDGDKII